jgi:hypothetical protein
MKLMRYFSSLRDPPVTTPPSDRKLTECSSAGTYWCRHLPHYCVWKLLLIIVSGTHSQGFSVGEVNWNKIIILCFIWIQNLISDQYFINIHVIRLSNLFQIIHNYNFGSLKFLPYWWLWWTRQDKTATCNKQIMMLSMVCTVI